MSLKNVALTVCVLSLMPSKAGEAAIIRNQEETRTTDVAIAPWPDYATPPIQVIGTRYRGAPVVARFQAPSTWMNDLTVRVRNVSAQTIYYIEVMVEFPRDANDNPVLPSFFLQKGKNYLFGLTGESDLALAPGELIELAPTQDEIRSFARQVAAIAPPDNMLHLATVRAWVAAISQTRCWYKGAYLDRDPADFTHWIVDHRNEGRNVGMLLKRAQPPLALKPMSYQPFVASTTRPQSGGCVFWDDIKVDRCTDCGGVICTAAHDTYVGVPIGGNGFRIKCTNDTCKHYNPDGTSYNCSCRHLEIHVNENNPCAN